MSKATASRDQLIFLILALFQITIAFAADSTWSCDTLDSSNVSGDGAIQWQRLNCTGITPEGNVGPMVFNVVRALLTSSRVSLRPAVASATASTSKSGLQALDDMAVSMQQESLPTTASVAAGINGGYFFRLDESHFIDNVCWLKTREDAEQAPEVSHPNYGLSDGLVVIDGQLAGSNCDCLGYARPTSLIINQTHSYIDIQHRGDPAPDGTLNAIAAGPNLVSEDSTGTPYVYTPSDDHNINILEHSSNTAVGLVRGSLAAEGAFEQVIFSTADGHDGCSKDDQTCGINAKKMAYWMMDGLGCNVAMEHDQGGSTTMLVKDQGIVTNPGGGARPIFSGLFLVLDA